MATLIKRFKFCKIEETADALRVAHQTIIARIKQGTIKSRSIGRPILIADNNNLRAFSKNY